MQIDFYLNPEADFRFHDRYLHTSNRNRKEEFNILVIHFPKPEVVLSQPRNVKFDMQIRNQGYLQKCNIISKGVGKGLCDLF